MKTILAVLFVLIGSSALAPVTAQTEHAPSVEQCRADQKLWWAQAKDTNLLLSDLLARETRDAEMRNG